MVKLGCADVADDVGPGDQDGDGDGEWAGVRDALGDGFGGRLWLGFGDGCPVGEHVGVGVGDGQRQPAAGLGRVAGEASAATMGPATIRPMAPAATKPAANRRTFNVMIPSGD